MTDFGIKITKPGASITSTNVDDYQFWSKYPIMKTYRVGTYSYTFPSYVQDVTITITHNLGHAKCVWFSYDGSAYNPRWIGNDLLFYGYNTGGGAAVIFYWVCKSNLNNIQIIYKELHTGSGDDNTGKTWNFKYYIFAEDWL